MRSGPAPVGYGGGLAPGGPSPVTVNPGGPGGGMMHTMPISPINPGGGMARPMPIRPPGMPGTFPTPGAPMGPGAGFNVMNPQMSQSMALVNALRNRGVTP